MDAAVVVDWDAAPRHLDDGREPPFSDRTTSNAAPQPSELEEAWKAMEEIFHRPKKR